MICRTIQETVTFYRPFVLNGIKPAFPAGTYRVEIGEERIDSLSFQFFMRTDITFYFPGGPPNRHATGKLKLTPHELNTALVRDRGTSLANLGKLQRGDRQAENDRKAVERAENEGMALPEPATRPDTSVSR